MRKTIQFNEYIKLSEMKPEVSANGIFFPVSVEYIELNQYHGDARSFGYHFDDGECSVVDYKQVVGALADDTIALFEECANLKKYMKQPHHSMLKITEVGDYRDVDNAELLIRYDDEYFYKDENGFFFKTKYFCYGEPHRVTNESAEIYREVNREYQRQIKKYNSIMEEALNNIRALKGAVECL